MKVIKMLVVFLSFVLTNSLTQAAEYIVQPGDTLTSIAEVTNHEVSDIITMNELSKNAKIFPGQKLTFVSTTDKDFAIAWLNYVSINDTADGELVYKCETKLQFLYKNNIQYGSNPNGIHYTVILDYVMFRINYLNLRAEKEPSLNM